MPIPLLLLTGELWRSAFFAGTERGAYTAAMWLTRAGAIAHVTLFLLWVLLACRSVANVPPSRRPLAYWGQAMGKTPN